MKTIASIEGIIILLISSVILTAGCSEMKLPSTDDDKHTEQPEGDGSDNNDNDGNDNDGNDNDNNDNDNNGNEDNGTSPTTGNSFGWFELPKIIDEDGDDVIDGSEQLYYAHHLCAGAEIGPNGKKARNYTVCYSGKYHCPVWVAAPRHEMYAKKNTSRTDAYGFDPKIPKDIQYRSKKTGDGCNKGHMLGSAERLCSRATNEQVFYYTNIAPQLSAGFNTGGGGWNLLEDFIDTVVPADTLYEVIGCYFEEYTDGYGNKVKPKKISFGSRDDVSFPTMFYYAVLRTKKGNSNKSVTECQAEELQCVAFVRSHTNNLKGQKPSSREMMSISDLERITGFTYFANVPAAPKSTFKASDWGL